MIAKYTLPLVLFTMFATDALSQIDDELTKVTAALIDTHCASRVENKRNYCLSELVASLENQEEGHELNSERLDLLSRALRKLTDWTDDGALKQELRDKEISVYELMIEQDENDSDARYYLALAQKTEEQKVRFLREVVDRDPNYLAARLSLAHKLTKSANTELMSEGTNHYREGYQRLEYGPGEGSWKVDLAGRAYNSLVRTGHTGEATSFKHQVYLDLSVDDNTSATRQAILSAGAFADKARAVQHFVAEYCTTVFIDFDMEPCLRGIKFGEQLLDIEPRHPLSLRALIFGLEKMDRANQHTHPQNSARLRELYATIEEIDSLSSEERFKYAMVLPPQERLAALEALVAKESEVSVHIRASLAETLIQAGRSESAFEQYRVAFGQATGRHRYQYGSRLLELLRAQGAEYEPEALDLARTLLEES